MKIKDVIKSLKQYPKDAEFRVFNTQRDEVVHEWAVGAKQIGNFSNTSELEIIEKSKKAERQESARIITSLEARREKERKERLAREKHEDRYLDNGMPSSRGNHHGYVNGITS